MQKCNHGERHQACRMRKKIAQSIPQRTQNSIQFNPRATTVNISCILGREREKGTRNYQRKSHMQVNEAENPSEKGQPSQKKGRGRKNWFNPLPFPCQREGGRRLSPRRPSRPPKQLPDTDSLELVSPPR